ncbi:Chemotaxis protein LafU [Pseudomonas fluorescens]|uniref:OmpA family protein n=1 Tax=Pseudomonas fluorescens TaxID=294 RepID=UPI00125521E0|nr:OmpA family protein [Pseudomonas fluorescens]CAG8871059.1 Chemotaxis protein LafU [Pseudomonas fluorescens]VVP69096.1 Chemotaxis protein LafU [Pseudomonas fluorescens]
MRRRNDQNDKIIVKRRSKRWQGEEQTGAWKVAFADFTLAMMALFMVLWIIQPQADGLRLAQTSDSESLVVDAGAGIFDGISRVPLDYVAVAPIKPPEPEPAVADVDVQPGSDHYDSPEQLESLAELMRLLAERADALANVEAHVVPQGLRILIKDDPERFMFERGSASLSPHFRQLLAALAQELVKVENKLIISGHTDATPYRGNGRYDNWNLSGERALQARSVLVAAGLPMAGVLQVSAQADVMPLRPEDPLNGANRRIELLLLTRQAEALYRRLFSEDYVRYSGASADYVRALEP